MDTMIELLGAVLAQLLLAALFVGTFLTVRQLIVLLFMRRPAK